MARLPTGAVAIASVVAALVAAGCTDHSAPSASPRDRVGRDVAPPPDARVAAAMATAAEGRYDDAIHALETIHRDRALAEPDSLSLADLYLRADRAADAVRHLQPRLGRAPSRAVRVTAARALLVAGDAVAAVTHLQAGSGAGDGDATHQALLGRALLATADVGGARRAFARAVERDPAQFEARLALARLTGREPLADVADAWTAALAARVGHAPDDAGIRLDLARAHVIAGRPVEAERALREALALRSALPEAHFALARLLLASGRTDEAIPHLHAVLRGVHRHRQANVLLAEHYEGVGDAARAATHLEHAYGDPRPLDVTLRLASLHMHARRLDTALALATTAVREAPRSATAHAVLGRVHRVRGDTRAATVAWQTALDLDRDLVAAHLTIDPSAAVPETVRAAREPRRPGR